VRGCVLVGEFEEDQSCVDTGQLNPVKNADGLDGAGLGSEPALMRQIGEKKLLEELKAGSGEQAFERRGEEFEGTLTVFDSGRLGCFGSGLEFEPEEGIRRESECVRLRGDSGKGNVSKHLDRNHAVELHK